MIKNTKFGWIDLSNLEFNGKSFNWNKSIGAVLPFEHMGIQGELHIKEKVNAQYVKVDISGYVQNAVIYVGHIKNNQLGSLLGVYTSEFRYNPGDVIGSIRVEEQILKSDKHDKKYYKCACLIDGYT